MGKIVYLFGAGASANALPVVNQMPDRIKKMIDELPELEAKEVERRGGGTSCCSNDDMKVLKTELQWLLDVIGGHATMDTLAKKLWIQSDFTNYNRLRMAISAFFILEQAYGKADTRYETFLVSLCDGAANTLSDRVSILSWNYDSQFELAYHNLGLQYSSSINDIHAVLGIDTNRIEREKFKVLKLNGSALLSVNDKIANFFWNNERRSVADYVCSLYYNDYPTKTKNIGTSLSFAWDTHNRTENLFEHIESRTKDADILVVIGYSFPYFNRTIDRKIIESMPKLKKIYFQDMRPENIAKAFKAISDKYSDIIEKTDYTDQFFLPPEL